MSREIEASIQSWLKQVGLDKYSPVFAEHEVTLKVLPLLTTADIDRLGLPIGPRRALITEIQKLGHAVQTGLSKVDAQEDLARPLEAQGAERRQLTLMFCDLVGSTALSERLDPEELRDMMRAYRTACGDVVARYEGYVARYLGDGQMVYFGWPQAHEDDAERCVRAALEIVQAVRAVNADPPLAVRIGVATGTVVVGEVSQPAHAEAVGETPNLAARLQGLAGPGEIVISSATRRLVSDTFDVTDLGTHHLKGIAAPVRAWRVMSVGHAVSRFDAIRGEQLTPLVGREQEIGLLLDRRELAFENEGQVVLLSGEPGIGKSRLIMELRKRLEAQGVQALRFQCSPYYVNHALWPSIDYFERTLKFSRDESPESKLEKVEALIGNELDLPPSDVRFVASMLSIPCEGRYGNLALTPQKQKEETLRTLVDAVEVTARKRPSVVLFEDLHWADATTREVLDLMVNRLKSMPLLIVLTHRPEFQNRWASHDHVAAIDLSRLTRAQSATMVSRLAGAKTLPRDLVEEILTKTDGVPLFVEELTKSILESGELKDTGDHYEYIGQFRTFTVPATLRDSLMARLDRSAPVKEIAQIGAAIGREFSYELIAAVAPQPETVLKQALERLTASGLAVRRGTLEEATYSFKHALVQDAAYDSMLKRNRQQLHTEIARTIEERFPNIKDIQPEVLAHHYTRAALYEQGAAYWIKAGQNALSRMALREAIAHLDAGLGVIEHLPPSKARDKLELQCRVSLSTAWLALEGWASKKLKEVLEPVRALAISIGQPEVLAPTLWGLWVQMMSIGTVAESLVRAEDLLRTGDTIGNGELRLVGHMAIMVTNFWLGNPRVVEEHAVFILDLYDDQLHGHIVKWINHDPKTLAEIYLSQAKWILGFPEQAAKIVDARNDHARSAGHAFDLGFALTLGAWVFHYRREPEKQLALAAAAQELAQDANLPFLSEVLLPFLSTGISLAQQGRLSEGIADMERGIQGWKKAGAETVTPYIKSRLGEAIALRGDVDAGLSHVDAMLEQIARPGWQERSHLAEILRLKGWMLSLGGDNAGAEQCYLASKDWAQKQGAKSWELRTATSLARLWQAQGKRKEAYKDLASIYGQFTEGFDTKDLIEAKALLEELGER